MDLPKNIYLPFNFLSEFIYNVLHSQAHSTDTYMLKLILVFQNTVQADAKNSYCSGCSSRELRNFRVSEQVSNVTVFCKYMYAVAEEIEYLEIELEIFLYDSGR